jgi:hypothetical protein
MGEEHAEHDPTWLVEPPGPGEVHVYVTTGEGASLSDGAREALEELIQELQRGETEGFAPLPPDCPSFSDCSPYTCTLKTCQPQWRNPCFVDAGCKIAEFGRIG